MDLKIFLSVLASICGIIAPLPYLWGALFGQVRPHAFTWLIWTISATAATAGVWQGGGGIGAVPPTISVLFNMAILLASLRFGWQFIKKSDIVALSLAIAAIGIWIFLKSPALAVLIVSIVEIIGYIPTFRKSFKAPWTENIFTWGLFATASCLAILALENYNFLTLCYLVTIFLFNSAMAIYLLARRKILS